MGACGEAFVRALDRELHVLPRGHRSKCTIPKWVHGIIFITDCNFPYGIIETIIRTINQTVNFRTGQ